MEVFQLASRHYSLEMTELADVRDLMIGFESHNQVTLECRFSVVWRQLKPDVVMTMLAHNHTQEIGEVPPLASVSVRCSATNLRTWNAVLTHAMYALDFQLALSEMPEPGDKKA
jgi:hypothetical protein